MVKKTDQNQIKEIGKLLNQQTIEILNAVSEKLRETELEIDQKIDKKIKGTELRINQKIERLTTTLDRFLKRLTDAEDEFEIMKMDINRMKKIMKERLGVEVI